MSFIEVLYSSQQMILKNIDESPKNLVYWTYIYIYIPYIIKEKILLLRLNDCIRRGNINFISVYIYNTEIRHVYRLFGFTINITINNMMIKIKSSINLRFRVLFW